MQDKLQMKTLGKQVAVGVMTGLGVGLLANIVIMTLVLLISSYAHASNNAILHSDDTIGKQEVTRGSLLFKTMKKGRYLQAPTLKTDVDMKISGMVARVRVKQHFHNSTNEWLEGVYVFPLPENSAVDHLKMRVGERVIEGKIKEKGEAKRIYKKAVREGRKAALLEQERPNIFTNSVANIGPGEDVIIEINYQQILRYDKGSFRLRFPMVVGPRYIPGSVPALPSENEGSVSSFAGTGWASNTGQVPDASRITPPVLHPSKGPVNPVSMTIALTPGFPLARLDSSYHKIDVREDKGHNYSITMNKGVFADRDFELVWTPDTGHTPNAALFNQTIKDDSYVLLMMMPPDNQAQQQRLSREVIYVIDTSGSMHGTSIAQAREALLLALNRLKPGDRFNIIQFNSYTDMLFPKSRPVTQKTLVSARQYVKKLYATGGTEMAGALNAALNNQINNEDNAGIVRQVIFLTDGSVGNEDRLFTIIKQKLGKSRLFTVGIGSAPNSHFMSKAAKHGRGTFTYIGKVEEVREKMNSLFRKLETPVLTDIRITWPKNTQVETWPDHIPDLYVGEPVIVTARMDKIAGDIFVSGRRAGAPWKSRLQLAGGAVENGIGKLWARKKIAALMDKYREGHDKSTVRQSIIDVALNHHLVSKFTSLVAVDITPTRSSDASSHKRAIPVNLPKGWTYEKVFGGLPQTATPATLQILTGVLLLLAALWLFGLQYYWRRSLLNEAGG